MEKCSNCGEMFPESELEALCIGKSRQLLCGECLASGRRKVDGRAISRFAKERGKWPK